VGGANVRRALAVYHHRLPTSPTVRAAWVWASTVPPTLAATVNSRRMARAFRTMRARRLARHATITKLVTAAPSTACVASVPTRLFGGLGAQ
jgi:hypothetical protein